MFALRTRARCAIPVDTRAPTTPGRCPLEAWLQCLETDGPVGWRRLSAEAGDGSTPRPPQLPRSHPVTQRIGALALPGEASSAAPAAGAPPVAPLNLKAAELVAAATSSANLGRMPPGWQAWL